MTDPTMFDPTRLGLVVGLPMAVVAAVRATWSP